jgi:hypothetical protein
MRNFTEIAAGVGAVTALGVAAFFNAGFLATAACAIISGAAGVAAAKLVESCTKVDTKKDDDAVARHSDGSARPAPIVTNLRSTSPIAGTPSQSSVRFQRRMDWADLALEKQKQRKESEQKTP